MCKGLIHIDLQMTWDQSRLDNDLFLLGSLPLQTSTETNDQGKHDPNIKDKDDYMLDVLPNK